MPINWERASQIAQCVQAVAVTVTLGFIVYQLGQQAYHLEQQSYQLQQQAYQLEQQVRLTRAANVHSLAELMIPINMKLTEREMAELWEYGPGESNGPDDKEQAIKESQYTTLLASHLIFYENVYSQYQAGLLPEKIYRGWNADLEGVIEGHAIENYWQTWREGYQDNFRNHIDELLRAKATPSPSPSPSP